MPVVSGMTSRAGEAVVGLASLGYPQNLPAVPLLYRQTGARNGKLKAHVPQGVASMLMGFQLDTLDDLHPHNVRTGHAWDFPPTIILRTFTDEDKVVDRVNRTIAALEAKVRHPPESPLPLFTILCHQTALKCSLGMFWLRLLIAWKISPYSMLLPSYMMS
jgi:hypothetical protein